MPRPEKKIDAAGVSDFGFHNFQLLHRLRWLTWTGCSRIEDTWRVDKHRSKVGVKEQKTHVYKQNLNNILDVFLPHHWTTRVIKGVPLQFRPHIKSRTHGNNNWCCEKLAQIKHITSYYPRAINHGNGQAMNISILFDDFPPNNSI